MRHVAGDAHAYAVVTGLFDGGAHAHPRAEHAEAVASVYEGACALAGEEDGLGGRVEQAEVSHPNVAREAGGAVGFDASEVGLGEYIGDEVGVGGRGFEGADDARDEWPELVGVDEPGVGGGHDVTSVLSVCRRSGAKARMTAEGAATPPASQKMLR